MHAAAKTCGATVTGYLIAAVICALRREMPPAERGRAIHMDVPVDLRSLFGSTTLRNFFGLAYVTYVPGDTDEPLSAIAAQVQEQLATGTEPASLKRRMMRMVKLEKNPIVRAVPLFLKDAALDFAAWRATRRGHLHGIQPGARRAGCGRGALRGGHQRHDLAGRAELHPVHLRGRFVHRRIEPLREPASRPPSGRRAGR